MASLILFLSLHPLDLVTHYVGINRARPHETLNKLQRFTFTRGNEWIHDTFSPFFACLLRLDISYPRTCHVMSCLVDSCFDMLKAFFSLQLCFYIGVFRGFRGFHLSYAFMSIMLCSCFHGSS